MTTLASQSISPFLHELGAKSPTPGGGAAASCTGAIAVSLARMVVSYSLGKKTLAEHQADLEKAAGALDRASGLFLELAEEDALSYAAVNELQKLPETDERRTREWPAAVEAAVQAPLAVAAAAADLLRLLESLVEKTNKHLRSDLAIAAVLAEAAVSGGCWNVRVNVPLLANPSRQGEVEADVRRMLQDATARRATIERGCGLAAG
ncbi:MAG: cyclodeaminase/cyclohydrolase family protein [Pyrinomonadaceae bacterium]|nr:cyclodeaminase/cyclohydrolase family protein [Phycisphaerales bacterium]